SNMISECQPKCSLLSKKCPSIFGTRSRRAARLRLNGPRPMPAKLNSFFIKTSFRRRTETIKGVNEIIPQDRYWALGTIGVAHFKANLINENSVKLRVQKI